MIATISRDHDRDHTQLFIGGDWAAPAGVGSIQVVNPSTEDVIGSLPDTSPGDIDAAVAAARERFADALEKRGWPGHFAESTEPA